MGLGVFWEGVLVGVCVYTWTVGFGGPGGDAVSRESGTRSESSGLPRRDGSWRADEVVGLYFAEGGREWVSMFGQVAECTKHGFWLRTGDATMNLADHTGLE